MELRRPAVGFAAALWVFVALPNSPAGWAQGLPPAPAMSSWSWQLEQTLSLRTDSSDWRSVVTALATSSDGDLVACGRHMYRKRGPREDLFSVEFRDAQTFLLHRSVKVPELVRRIAFAPDGRSVICGLGPIGDRMGYLSRRVSHLPGQIVVVAIDEAKIVSQVAVDAGVQCLGFASSGKLLVGTTGENRGTLCCFTCPELRSVYEWKAPGELVDFDLDADKTRMLIITHSIRSGAGRNPAVLWSEIGEFSDLDAASPVYARRTVFTGGGEVSRVYYLGEGSDCELFVAAWRMHFQFATSDKQIPPLLFRATGGPSDVIRHKRSGVVVMGGRARISFEGSTAWLSAFDPATGEHLATTERDGAFYLIEPLGDDSVVVAGWAKDGELLRYRLLRPEAEP